MLRVEGTAAPKSHSLDYLLYVRRSAYYHRTRWLMVISQKMFESRDSEHRLE